MYYTVDSSLDLLLVYLKFWLNETDKDKCLNLLKEGEVILWWEYNGKDNHIFKKELVHKNFFAELVANYLNNKFSKYKEVFTGEESCFELLCCCCKKNNVNAEDDDPEYDPLLANQYRGDGDKVIGNIFEMFKKEVVNDYGKLVSEADERRLVMYQQICRHIFDFGLNTSIELFKSKLIKKSDFFSTADNFFRTNEDYRVQKNFGEDIDTQCQEDKAYRIKIGLEASNHAYNSMLKDYEYEQLFFLKAFYVNFSSKGSLPIDSSNKNNISMSWYDFGLLD